MYATSLKLLAMAYTHDEKEKFEKRLGFIKRGLRMRPALKYYGVQAAALEPEVTAEQVTRTVQFGVMKHAEKVLPVLERLIAQTPESVKRAA